VATVRTSDRRRWRRRTGSGFSLIELVIVITILGIVAAMVSRIVVAPVRGYMDSSRRARLVGAADTALKRVTREIRLGLPNSVRVAVSGQAIEFLRIRTGGRYRAEGPGDALDFSLAGDTFDVIGPLPDAASIVANAGAGVGDCVNGVTDCLVVYNTGQPGADAYAGDNVAAIRAASAGAIEFIRATPFPLRSPSGRFYVVDTPVTYLCDAGAGTVRRYHDYAVTAAHTAVDTAAELNAAGAVSELLIDGVSACAFTYAAGTATRGGLATLSLSLAESGEAVSLLQQVHVSNLP